MENNSLEANDWITRSDSSIGSIIFMVVELDRRDLIPLDMRQAFAHHGGNLVDDLPNFIQATATMFAKAHGGNCGVSEWEGSQANWAVTFMASALSSVQFLAKIEREREECPEIYAAMRKSRGSTVSLVKAGNGEATH
jgi:hypothetical protein